MKYHFWHSKQDFNKKSIARYTEIIKILLMSSYKVFYWTLKKILFFLQLVAIFRCHILPIGTNSTFDCQKIRRWIWKLVWSFKRSLSIFHNRWITWSCISFKLLLYFWKIGRYQIFAFFTTGLVLSAFALALVLERTAVVSI